MTDFGYPDTGRGGLGNMLFPWARCFLWCKDQNIPMLNPQWERFRIGPYLRMEHDKRHYGQLFRSDSYITGIRRIEILVRSQYVEERTIRPHRNHRTYRLIIFRGMDSYFEKLVGRHLEISDELYRITRPSILSKIEKNHFIGIHVRRGDFGIPSNNKLLTQGSKNLRIPIEWYVQALRTIRKILNETTSAFIASDGTSNELEPLLQEPNVQWNQHTNAIVDLLSLANSRVLITSGSTFSMWASYLGQVPTIWYQGQYRQSVGPLEIEWSENNTLPDNFKIEVFNRWKNFSPFIG